MFRHIMAPVDLAHLGRLERALAVAAEESKHHGARITYVSVTAATPGAIARTPEEFRRKLDDFAAEQAGIHGIEADAHAIISHDPSIEMDDALVETVHSIGADLVVMASHKPALADYFWPSNGGRVATHTDASVMLVRDA